MHEALEEVAMIYAWQWGGSQSNGVGVEVGTRTRMIMSSTRLGQQMKGITLTLLAPRAPLAPPPDLAGGSLGLTMPSSGC